MQNLKEYQQTKFYGVNDSTAALALGGYEAKNIENWLIRFQGKLVRRMGQTEVGTDAGTTGVNNIAHWVSGSTNVKLKVIDKTIKSLSVATWSNHGSAPTFTSAGDVNFCFAKDYLYAFNGTDSPKKIGQTTSADVATIPAGSWAVWYRNYLIVGGVAAYPSRIYISNLNDPETYTAADYIDIEPGDGDILTGGIVSGPDKVFFTKNNTIHYMTGAGTNTFAVYPLVRDFGIASHRSLLNVGADVWGVTPDGRIMSLLKNQYGLYSGQDMASDYLETTLRTINQQVTDKAIAANINGYLMFGVASGSSTTNDLILVYDTLAPINTKYSKWTKITGWDITCFDILTDVTDAELYMGDADTNQVFKWFGNTDDGTVITATWEGPEMEFESVGSPKRFRQIKITGYPLGDFNVAVHTSVDNGTYTDLGDFNLSAAGGIWGTSIWGAFLWGSVGIVKERLHFSNNAGKVYGYKAQIKFIYNANSDEPTLGTFSVFYTPRRWR
jgi:hypothetical protein